MNPRLWLFTTILCLCLVSVACQPIQPPTSTTLPTTSSTVSAEADDITITYTDEGITAPSGIPGGLVTFNFVDERSDPQPSEPQIVRLAGDATLDDYTQALGSDRTRAGEMISALGGAFGRNHFVLTEGTYFATLAGPPTEGPPHMAAFTVTAPPTDEALPTADVKVEMLDFSFAMPDELTAGPQLWHIANGGAQSHHLLIWQRNEGTSHEEFLAGFLSDTPPSGPPPIQWVTGWAATGPGEGGWLELDLAPGEYEIVSFLPDFSESPPVKNQLEQGMHHLLTVK